MKIVAFACLLSIAGRGALPSQRPAERQRPPNILIAIADDQSWPYASAYGCSGIETPAFDRVAREGVLFRNGFAASPGCGPSRAALLTGRHTWQLEHAGTHASSFSARYATFPDLLEAAGYHVGYTGKGWGPGSWKAGGRSRNPAGPAFQKRKSKPPHAGMSANDYAGNFADFLGARSGDEPFCFWFGAHEPHRGYAPGIGVAAGKQLADARVPAFLPDVDPIRSDILDYCVEVEWFDAHLQRMLAELEKRGQLDDTLVIVTADNGMPFPRAKANVYEYGIHVPLAMRWGRAPGGRVVDDLVGFVDLTATILDVAGVAPPREYPPSGRSIAAILASDRGGVVEPDRDAVYAARERHSSSRWNNLAYPQRALRTPRYLYIRNFKPERWPAGAPRKLGKNGELGPMHGGYHDIDACPSLTCLIRNREDDAVARFLSLAVDHRPADELYDVRADPACLRDLAREPEHAERRAALSRRLLDYLRSTGDPRVVAADGGAVWETYRRYSRIRRFPPPAWARDGRDRDGEGEK